MLEHTQRAILRWQDGANERYICRRNTCGSPISHISVARMHLSVDNNGREKSYFRRDD